MKSVLFLHRRKGKRLLCAVLVLSLLLSFLPGCTTRDDSKAFDSLMDTIFKDEVSSDIITLHFTLTDPAAAGIKNYNVTLGDLSKEYFEESTTDTKDYLKQLKALNRSSLNQEQKLTYDVVSHYLEDSLCPESYYYFNEPLSPIEGIQGYLPTYFAEYDFNTRQDIEDYMDLFPASYDYFKQIAAFETEKSQAGLFMTDTQLNQVIDQCQSILDDKTNFFLYQVFDEKIEAFDGLTQAEKEAYKEQNTEGITNHLFPAYQLLITELSKLAGSGSNQDGICKYQNGKAYYQYLIQNLTGSHDSVDTMYQEMENLLSQSYNEAMSEYAKDQTLYDQLTNLSFPESKPEKILTYLQDAMKDDYPVMDQVSYTIKYVPESMSEYLSPAFYLIPPVDQETDNSIYLNLGSSGSSDDLFPTLAHEGFPGHMYQFMYFSRVNHYPIRQLLTNTSYSEGWAMYAENDSYRLAGLSDSLCTFAHGMYLTNYLLSAMVDIGIHDKGWTRSQAASFFADYGLSESDVSDTLDLIQENPGYYVKYVYGYMKFLEMRQEAEKKPDFNSKEYHTFILETGPCQFYLLDDLFDDWMKK